MPRGRLIFDGDNQYTEKEKRIHKLTQEVENKIDNIPGVVDDANSISTTDALSARMGKVLQDQINELKSMGRFLSTWDCVNGLPTTDPLDNPYDYRIGDYYIVSAVGAGTNYRPMGATYVHGQASTAVETEVVKINDWYLYDGAHWILQNQDAVEIAIDTDLSTSSTHAVENRAITTAINAKQNIISDLDTIRSGAARGATSVQPGDSLSVLDNTATGFQTAGDVANAIAGKADTSTVNALDGRVTTVEGTVATQAQAIADLQQSEGGTSQDVSDLKDDVAAIESTIGDINTALAGKVDASSLSAVATSGNASDLNNDAGFITSSYIGNGQITVTQNGVNKGSFTLNQSGAATIALTDSDTTYNTVSVADIQTGTGTTAGVVTPANLASATVRIASNTSGTKTQVRTGTQAEYDALSVKDSNTLYFTVDN